MVTIKLAEPWTYRTPQKTIHYPAGEHSVFQYVADQAEAEGVTEASDNEGTEDGDTGSAATPDAPRTHRSRKG